MVPLLGTSVSLPASLSKVCAPASLRKEMVSSSATGSGGHERRLRTGERGALTLAELEGGGG